MDSSQAEREARIYKEGRELLLQRIMEAEKEGKTSLLPYSNYLIRQVLVELIADIKNDSKPRGNRGAGAFKKFALYLGSLDPKITALRAIQAALEGVIKSGGADKAVPIWREAATWAGRAVYREYLATHFRDVNPAMFNSLMREYSRAMTKNEAHLVAVFKAKMTKEGIEYPTWPFGDVEHVGQYLITRMVAHGLFESWSKTERVKGKATVRRYLKVSEELRAASIDIVDSYTSVFNMWGALIEPPKDWDPATNSGGGFHSAEAQRSIPYAVQGNGPTPVSPVTVETINLLQQRRWQINEEVLRVVRAGSAIRDFGDVVSTKMGPKPEWVEGAEGPVLTEWKAAAREWWTQKKLRTSKGLMTARTLTEAQDLAQYPCIWFTYFADFRGRKYVVTKGVSPQGNDLEKGLLRMWVGKPVVTESAAKWFRIHGANKWGLDKLTLEEREAWVVENDAMLRDMGANPLDHTEWMDCDCPVQFLSWVMEYSRWREDPQGFLSHLPMGQDGTCNGLQNFSALMRDSVGGAATNLLPGAAPRDIYKDVADEVIKLLRDTPQSLHRDLWLQHGINRKVTKRTTMTLPYGCTRYACSTFVRDYIEETDMHGFPMEEYGNLANYLSRFIWAALDKVVVKAREVMLWLRDWASFVAASGKRVSWVTPSGLLVRNHYEKYKTLQVKSAAFKSRIRINSPTGLPDTRKISNAVSPNFVHSLDASHLDRVVRAACAEGMEPVTIHDDFGVHAADTERFHEIIREEFVGMYDGLELLEDMQKQAGYPIPPPTRGDLDIHMVKQSKYFFA